MPYDKHCTLIETRKERMEKGKKVDDGNNLVAGIGGLQSFNSILELLIKINIEIYLKEMK